MDKVISGEEVPEGKIITYKVTIENAGSDDAKNVKISGVIPEGTTYVEITNYEGYGETEYYPNEKIKNFEKTYETINIGQTIVFEY